MALPGPFPVHLLGIHGEECPIYALRMNPGSLPAPEWVAWIGIAIAGATFPLILLLFPTGRVPSPRWRPVPWLLGGATLWAVAFYAVQPRPIYPMPGLRVENPAGIEALADVGGSLIAIGTVTAILAAVACFVGLFLRFRHARGEERQQCSAGSPTSGSSLMTAGARIRARGSGSRPDRRPRPLR